MNEEGLIIKIKRDPNLRHLIRNPKKLMHYAKQNYPWLNMETLTRYQREYKNRYTPMEDRYENKPDWITFSHEK